MQTRRDQVPYVVCLGTLLWLAASAFAAPPPNASGCPGAVMAGMGQSATLSCGAAACGVNGQCSMTSGHAIGQNDKIVLYHYDAATKTWKRTGVNPPQGSTLTECACATPVPGQPGQYTYVYGAANCCHVVEVNYPDGSQRAATRGTCFDCPAPGRCFVVGQPLAPAIGEADCVVN